MAKLYTSHPSTWTDKMLAWRWFELLQSSELRATRGKRGMKVPEWETYCAVRQELLRRLVRDFDAQGSSSS
jgi:hypothetical protein